MNQKELKELIEFLIEKDIAEFELERGDVKVRIKRAGAETHVIAEPRTVVLSPAAAPVAAPASASAAAAVPAQPPAGVSPAAAPADEPGLHIIRSPIVGTYYESASPGAPAFVKAGDTVEAGHVLCIIEAMKLMNEIESEVSGEIVQQHVKNAEPVEYGQALFSVRVKK